MNIERTDIAEVNGVLSNMNSETTEDTTKTNAEKNDIASVKLDDGPTKNAIEKKNYLETKEQKSEIVLGVSDNETETSTASNLVTVTCKENRGENNILKCPDTNKSEYAKISEILQTNENNNIIEANCDKLELSSSEEKKEKMKSFKAGKVVFATLKPKGKKNNSNLIYYAGIIINGNDCYLKNPRGNCEWVYWFLTKNVSMVPTEYIIDFAPNLMDVKRTLEMKVNPKHRQRHMQAVREAINVFEIRWNKVFSQTSFKKACSQFLNEYKKVIKHSDYDESCMPENVTVNLNRINHVNKKNIDDFIKNKKRDIAEKPARKRVVTIRGHRSTPQTAPARKSGWTIPFKDSDKSLSLTKRTKHLVYGKPWYEHRATYGPRNVAEMCTPILRDNLSSEILLKGEKRPIRVLSLFDGIGCGILALKQLGIEIEVYYVSEIDEDAINITNINHGGSGVVHHLGDVTTISQEMLRDISPINLLIGGSPCNDLSIVNHSKRGLHDGTGVLFFEFYRIRNSLEMMNKDKGVNLYWLYENVAAMEKHHKEGITQFLGTKEVVIDAVNYTPQRMTRLYWGNIPGLQDIPNEDTSALVCHSLQSVLTQHCNRIATSVHSSTITTSPVTIHQGVVMGDKLSSLWLNELEQLFGLPEHYTDYGLALQRRQCLIGRAGSVPVICKILKPLREIFLTTQ